MDTEKVDGQKKKALLKRVRKQRLKYIAVLPSLITLINGICGFAAICFASESGNAGFSFYKLDMPYFAVSGYLIFIAMIADMLDGRVARMSHSTSSFGGQLDSLCDLISFGVAPAFLVYKLLNFKLISLIDPPAIFSGFLLRSIWIASTVYLVCAAIRLARFNVENEEDETAHMDFVGLPTPAAAGVIASLVIFYEDMLIPLGPDSSTFVMGEKIIIFALPFITITIAVLMISRVIFPHLINKYFKGRKPLTHLAWAFIVISLIIWSVQTALLISFLGFPIFGYFRWLFKDIAKRRRQKKLQGEPPAPSITNSSEKDKDHE